MIYDCFCYNGERTLLEIRMQELCGHWSDIKPIAIEGTHTFTGIPKGPIDYRREMWSKYGLDHVIFNHTPFKDPWENERAQRNYILTFLEKNFHMEDDDTIIISDVDEIPKRHVILQYKPAFGVCSLVMDQMYYFLNSLASRQTWRHPKIMTYADLRTTSPEAIRNRGTALGLMDAGWHFSYTGGVKEITEKLAAFSHQEPSIQRLKDPLRLVDMIADLESPMDDDEIMTLIDLKELTPYIQDHAQELKNLGYIPLDYDDIQ